MQRGKPTNRLLDYWLGTPFLNVLATFRLRHRPPAAIRRIGVLCSPALGDTLLFSAPLQDIRAAWPQAHITHICMKQNLAAAEIIPGADQRLVISLTQPPATVKAIRAQKFDVLFDFSSWQRLTAFYSLLSGARYIVGFRTPGQHRARAYDRTVLHRDDVHEVFNFRALLAGSALTPRVATTHPPAITVTDPPEIPFAGEPNLVAFHLWASGQRSRLREWPESNWIALAKKIAQCLGSPETLFLITGAAGDLDRITPFVAALRAAGLRAEPFVSPDGFRTLTAVLRRARLVVSVNTGVMHLAAIAGAPTVSINGPNRNGRWGPFGPHAIGVEAPGPGCGYLHLGFNFDNQPTDCMERTTVDYVYAAACELLQPSFAQHAEAAL